MVKDMILDITMVQQNEGFITYNLTKEEISVAIVEYILKHKEIPVMDTYDIKFVVEDTYQSESLTGYYKPEFKGVEIYINQ